MLVLLLLALIHSSDAIVRFTDSMILDEFDLAVQEFDVDLCSASACKVFASAPKNSLSTLDNIFVGEKSLGYITRNKNRFSKLKTAYVSSGGLRIVNRNTNYACGPVVVYIVAESADFYDTALVYEPSSPSTTVKWIGSVPITILSAEPFRIAGDVNSGVLNGPFLTTGFDNARENSNKCTSVIDFRSEDSFSYYFNGPIATLYSPTEVEVDLYLGSFKSYYFSLETRGFVTSPGYIGCMNGDVYRSSLHSKKSTFHLTDKKKRSIHIYAFLNTVDPVQLEIDYHKKINLLGEIASNDWHQSLEFAGKSLDVTFAPTHDSSSFLLKFESDPYSSSPTSSSSSIRTTTEKMKTTEAKTPSTQFFGITSTPNEEHTSEATTTISPITSSDDWSASESMYDSTSSSIRSTTEIAERRTTYFGKDIPDGTSTTTSIASTTSDHELPSTESPLLTTPETLRSTEDDDHQTTTETDRYSSSERYTRVSTSTSNPTRKATSMKMTTQPKTTTRLTTMITTQSSHLTSLSSSTQRPRDEATTSHAPEIHLSFISVFILCILHV